MTEQNQMRKLMKIAPVLLVGISFWPVWIWFVERFSDKSDEPLGLLALVTFLVIYYLRSRAVGERTNGNETSVIAQDARNSLSSFQASTTGTSLKITSALLVLFILAQNQLPALVKAVFAVTCLVLAVKASIGRGKLCFGDWCLIYLSLPLVASFNFYAGYPLRLLSAKITTFVLNTLGMPVSQEGTLLSFHGSLVQIDAPCSGIKMMWLALYLMALFLSYFKVGTLRSILLMATAVLAAVLTNTFRVILLFLVEMHLIAVPPGNDEFVHQAIGLATFSLLTLAVGLAVYSGKGRNAARKSLDGSVKEPLPPGASENNTSENVVSLSRSTQTTTATRTLTGMRVLAVLCLIAAGLPFLSKTISTTIEPTKQHSAARAFPGWPETFEGRSLTPLLEDAGKGEAFASFPGKLRAFTDGKRTILMRWLTQPTRQLHPASDCYRAIGYEVDWQPLIIDGEGKRWSCFSAKQGKNLVFVKERIADENGGTWSDVSSWYWSAMLGSTTAPWWSITVEDEISPFKGKNKVSETLRNGAESTPETPY